MSRDLFSVHFHSDIWSNKWKGVVWSKVMCQVYALGKCSTLHRACSPVGETGCGKHVAGLQVISVVVSVIALVTARESAEIPA